MGVKAHKRWMKLQQKNKYVSYTGAASGSGSNNTRPARQTDTAGKGIKSRPVGSTKSKSSTNTGTSATTNTGVGVVQSRPVRRTIQHDSKFAIDMPVQFNPDEIIAEPPTPPHRRVPYPIPMAPISASVLPPQPPVASMDSLKINANSSTTNTRRISMTNAITNTNTNTNSTARRHSKSTAPTPTSNCNSASNIIAQAKNNKRRDSLAQSNKTGLSGSKTGVVERK